jgi:F-type H+-transporting ATPase subunit alpha
MRDAAANLRLEWAQYEDVKGFARFGAILDETTKRQLARGERLVSLLSQQERQVVPLAVQVVEFWALKTGRLDDLEPSRISEVEQRLISLAADYSYLEQRMLQDSTIDDELARQLDRWVQQAKTSP